MLFDKHQMGIKDIFRDIFQSKATSDFINNELDPVHKMQIFEMKAFFENLSDEEYSNQVTTDYKGKGGIDYLKEKLSNLKSTKFSYLDRNEAIKLVENIYNCFDLLFPRERFSHNRNRALNMAHNIFFSREDKAANLLLDALGLSANDKNYNENKARLLRLLESKAEIEKIASEAEYVNKRLTDIKENLNSSESDFKKEKELLLGKLRKENDDIKAELKKANDVNVEELQKGMALQRDAIKDTLNQLNLLKERLSVIDQNVYREELATFFLKEHDDIKGSIDPIYLLINLVSSIGFTEVILTSLKAHHIPLSYLNGVEVFFIVYVVVAKIGDVILKYKSKNDSRLFLTNLRGILTPYWCWLMATLIGMGTILYKALELSEIIKENLKNNVEPLHSVLPYFGMYVVLAWFTWFASKQFSYNKQICDEYEYKYALSKSYMLYKKEAESVITEGQSNAVLLSLLDCVIKNIAHSPVQSVKQDVHTPFSEVFKTVKEAANHKDLD